MIGIVDYGMGNLRSVQKACEYVGMQAEIVSSKNKFKECSHLILPGVGAFAQAIELLQKSHLKDCILDHANSNKPLLGICLGMQLMFDKSYEDGEWQGLGLIQGEIRKFSQGQKIPHVGWNNLIINRQTPLFDGIQDLNFYFTHSYHADKCLQEQVMCSVEYGYEFVVGVNKNNIYGVQFHPEKSGQSGLKLLKNFGDLQ